MSPPVDAPPEPATDPRRKSVLRIAAIGLVLAAVGLAGWLAIAPDPASPTFRGNSRDYVPTVPPAALPALSLTDLDGAPLDLGRFAGEVLVLNIWATWCAPCVEEMPALDRLAAALPPGGGRVLAVSLDRGGAYQVRPFLAANRITRLAVALDPKSSTLAALRLKGLPTTLVIDARGREVGRLEGAAAWDSPAALALIARVGTGG